MSIRKSIARTRAAQRPQPAPPLPPHPPDSKVQLETEWQFETSRFDPILTWIRNFPGTDNVGIEPPETVRHRDVYCDTRDWKIFHAGYAFRTRQRGKDVQATLKSVSGRSEALTIRREINQPAPASSPAAVCSAPGPVADRLRLLARPRQLRELADLRTTRTRFPLRRQGRPAGEIVLDRTVLHLRDGSRRRLLRVEVEVPPSLLKAMGPFVERLRTETGLAPAGQSKFEWALIAEGRVPGRIPSLGPMEVLPSMSTGEAAFAVLRKHFAAVLRHEPGTRLGDDPEHLHDMRVGTRRMRAALRIFSDVIPARDRERLRRELRVLGQQLGAVRDLDVQVEQIESWKSSLITVEPEALDPFLALLREKRDKAWRELLALLDSARYRRLVAFLGKRLARGPGRLPGARVPIRASGPDLVLRARKRVLRQEAAIRETSLPAEYHRLRILGKRWRYTLEFLAPIYGSPAESLVQSLTTLQDILGLHQDAHVLMAELPALARSESGRLPEATRFAVGEVAQLYAAQAARQRALFPESFREIRGKRWRALEDAMDAAVRDLAGEMLAAQVAQARARPRSGGIRSTRRPSSSAPGSAVSPRGARPSPRPRRGR